MRRKSYNVKFKPFCEKLEKVADCPVTGSWSIEVNTFSSIESFFWSSQLHAILVLSTLKKYWVPVFNVTYIMKYLVQLSVKAHAQPVSFMPFVPCQYV